MTSMVLGTVYLLPIVHFFLTFELFRAQADVDLPRIAVIGNQSAGKSSLVKAICNV